MRQALDRTLSHLPILALTVAGLVGCSGGSSTTENGDDTSPDPPVVADAPTVVDDGRAPERALFEPLPSDLVEPDVIYRQDGYGTIDVLRMDVATRIGEGACVPGDYAGCTFADIEADIDRRDELKPRIDVHFTAADYPEDGLIVNAEMRQRGGTTRKAAQKSFRVRLDDKDALWRRERSIYLNKHPYESDRIRNKLAFDLMAEMPHLFSMRTQFANLWIDQGTGPVDYGLFTHVEAPGANWLRKRGLNKDDRLYKINYFRFSDGDLANVQVDADGAPLDLERFERSLDIEAGDDHRPLVRMLTDFHDPTRSFDSLLDQYFNRNNVLTWMATNFLLHQTDAVTHNFILYNPLGTERFYFVPWDYDGGFAVEIEPDRDSVTNVDLQRRLYYGYARGINSDFHSRYFKLPGAHERIVAAAERLRSTVLSDANIDAKAQPMGDVVEPYVSRLPDIEYNPTWNTFSIDAFPRHVARNLEAMQTRFGIPMPSELDEDLELVDGSWRFVWTPAFDVTGHEITYDFLLSTSPAFEVDAIVVSAFGIEDDAERIEYPVDADALQPGTYYARVIARSAADPDRFWQVNRNDPVIDGVAMHGMERFELP